MSNNSEISLFASGDYLLDERQRYLYGAIERLQTYMLSLKDKLQEEKVMLSELKAETQYLSLQRATSAIPEEYLPTNYPCLANDCYHTPRSRCSLEFAGDMGRTGQVEEPVRNLDRLDYMHRLKEIDDLCKEEMSRVNSVAGQMEPFKQMASDWNLETRLSEMCVEPSLAKEMNAVLDRGKAQQNICQSESEPIMYSSTANTELVVLSSDQYWRPSPIISAIVPDYNNEDFPEIKTKSADDCGLSTDMKQELESQSVTVPKLEQLETPELCLDSALKRLSELMNHPGSKLEDIPIFEQGKPKRLMASGEFISPSTSEESLSTQEVMNDKKSVTSSQSEDALFIEVKRVENSVEDTQSVGSELSVKSVISLESIKRAFDSYKGKRKSVRSATSSEDNLSLVSGNKQEKKAERKRRFLKFRGFSDKSKKTKGKLMDVLNQSEKRLASSNWGGLDEKDKEKETIFKNTSLDIDESSKKEDSETLHVDDIINKFLYDEESYTYTPLFVSENRCNISSSSEES